MSLDANDPQRKTWLQVAKDTDFPIQNIPFGVFLTPRKRPVVGTRIGNYAIDLASLQNLGYFKGISLPEDIFAQSEMNAFIDQGQKTWRLVRQRIVEIFDQNHKVLQHNKSHRQQIIHPIDTVSMQLPVRVGDYTDFYSSKEHAMNVGKMFRGPENALKPNWLHMPVAYHGRSSSIIPSGVPVRRPQGQQMPKGADKPIFAPSKNIDFELETAFITSKANDMGTPVPIEKAEEHIFGMVLFNDWSARDIQRWEYVPLGPFLGKSFASSISPWIVTLDALEPFRCHGPQPEKEQLPYLQSQGKRAFDIQLEVALQPEGGKENHLATSNFKYLYWNISQQLAHQTVNGCPVNSGDMMGSGTISGVKKDSFGSLLELTWNGENPIQLEDGSRRRFIKDHDTIIMRGHAKNEKVRIGFGEVRSKLLPAL